MNFDPYDSAALRTFGMLDADENADFDDAMRDDPALRKYSLEMDRLSAAIAASMATPIQPPAGELERIQRRLGLHPSRLIGNWLAITGWAAAAVMVVILAIGRKDIDNQTREVVPETPRESTGANTSSDDEPTTKVLAKRLTQEIEVLRQNLEEFQQRDRVMFAALPGRSVPIVMTMNPPGEPTSDLSITTLLGDALKLGISPQEQHEETTVPATADTSEEPTALPFAMPIYDSARDTGTLVVSNLPDLDENEIYNLWVTTDTAAKPIFVGSLSESSAHGAVSFDFSLGSTTIMPTGFILTKDPLNSPASPSDNNIILQGPPPLVR